MLQANVNIGFNAHGRNSPCALSLNFLLLFLVSLLSHPFDNSFNYGEILHLYYGDMPTPCRVPIGESKTTR